MSDPKEYSTIYEQEVQQLGGRRLSNAQANQLTRRCICRAMHELLKERSLDEITATQVIERAGVSRSGFYRSYASKEDVLKEMGRFSMEQMMHSMQTAAQEGTLKSWYQKHFTYFRENPAASRGILDAPFPAGAPPKNMPIPPVFQGPDIRVRYRNIARLNAFHGILFLWLRGGMQESSEEMVELCMELLGNEPLVTLPA